MSTKPILVVMAAGMGSRYGGLKQIDPVGAVRRGHSGLQPLRCPRAGFETVVFIIKHEIEQAFKEAVGARALRAGFEVRYATSSSTSCQRGSPYRKGASSLGHGPRHPCGRAGHRRCAVRGHQRG